MIRVQKASGQIAPVSPHLDLEPIPQGRGMAEGKDPGWLAARLAKFAELRAGREEAVSLNLASARIEDAELGTNPQTQARLQRRRAKAEAYLAKQAARETGTDLERQNSATYTIEEGVRWREREEKRAAGRDPGFTDFTQMARRKFDRLADQIDPAALLRRSKEEALGALAAQVKDEQAKRLRRSRRRRFDDQEDVTYINERNYHFNKKAARAYDQYTEEIRDSLERGTAS